MAKKIKEQEINYDKTSLYFGYSARVSILIVLFTILIILWTQKNIIRKNIFFFEFYSINCIIRSNANGSYGGH